MSRVASPHTYPDRGSDRTGANEPKEVHGQYTNWRLASERGAVYNEKAEMSKWVFPARQFHGTIEM